MQCNVIARFTARCLSLYVNFPGSVVSLFHCTRPQPLGSRTVIRIFIHATALPLCLIIPTEMLAVEKIMEFVEDCDEGMAVLISKSFVPCHGGKKNYKWTITVCDPLYVLKIHSHRFQLCYMFKNFEVSCCHDACNCWWAEWITLSMLMICLRTNSKVVLYFSQGI